MTHLQRVMKPLFICAFLTPPHESAVFLVSAKTKLAPIQPLTVSRLVLNAARLLSRWMNWVRSILGERVTIVDTYAWTDSLVVLSWLTTPHETFKQYVSNCIHQIQTIIPECRWCHVPLADNPADCASFGCPGKLTQPSCYKIPWSN